MGGSDHTYVYFFKMKASLITKSKNQTLTNKQCKLNFFKLILHRTYFQQVMISCYWVLYGGQNIQLICNVHYAPGRLLPHCSLRKAVKKAVKLWTLSKLLKPPKGMVWTAKVWTLEDFSYSLGIFGYFGNKSFAIDKALRLLRLENLC